MLHKSLNSMNDKTEQTNRNNGTQRDNTVICVYLMKANLGVRQKPQKKMDRATLLVNDIISKNTIQSVNRAWVFVWKFRERFGQIDCL